MSSFSRLLIGCSLGVCLLPTVYAQGLPTTIYNEDVVVDLAVNGVAQGNYCAGPLSSNASTSLSLNGTCSGLGSATTMAQAVGIANPGSNPTLTVTATSTGPDPSTSFGNRSTLGDAYASIQGSFEIIGPSSIYVPVVVSGSGTGTSSGAARFLEYMSIGTSCDAGGCVNTNPLSSGGPFTVNETINVLSNSFQGISLSVEAQAWNGSAAASVDPLVSIDPTFLASHPGYSLEFSPGLIAPVPLPAAAWLLLSGLAGLGWTSRKRKLS